MSVMQVLRKCGQWSVALRPDAPTGIAEQLMFGHVVIVPGHLNPVERAAEMLTAARYVGVVNEVRASAGGLVLSGLGLESWLGDDEGKGPHIEHPAGALTGLSFADAIRALLPTSGAITEGTLYTGVPGTYTGNHAYQTSRTAIDYVCDTMGGEWRVTTTGELDAGPAASLFNFNPTCVIVRKDAGRDITLKALPGGVESVRSGKGYTTRVVLVAAALAGGTADATVVPYKDLHGNPVHITRVLDEQDDTLIANAAARAQAALTATNVIATTTRLSATDFDIAGDFQPGDAVWVYDPDAAVFDEGNEVKFRGRVIYPATVRVVSVTWPILDGYTVAHRSGDGVWTDLSPWVQWESEGGDVEVSDVLTSPLSARFGSIGTQVSGGGGGAGDTAVPGAPVFGTFTTTSYQPDDGLSRAAVTPTWTQPLNTDGSTVVDGGRYEIRYRPTGTTEWQVQFVPWDSTSVTITNLPPSTGFDWQIRAVDFATPTNYGAWSATTTFTTAEDTTPPATPAPPTVASSTLAVQVTHSLGLASGGTYNLPLDLDHLEVHVGASAGYTPDASTRVGKVAANAGMILGGIPAVATFDVDATGAVYVKVIAVDKTGNRSTPSSGATATALLIDSAHISDLTASKITAGTMTAAVILGGSIKTATSGARVEQDASGIRLYNSAGSLTVDLSAVTGDASIAGRFRTGLTGQRIEIDATGNGTIYFYPPTGTDYAYINAPSQNSCGVNAGFGGGSTRARMFVTPALGELVYVNAAQAQAGGRVMVDAGGVTVSGALSGSYLSAGATAATVYAASGGNASVQNSSGSYFSANGTGAYLNAPSGGEVIAGVSSGPYVWARAGDMDIQGNAKLWLLGSTVELGTGGGGEHLKSLTVYNNTSTFAANVGIATTPVGTFWRLTSSARYKVDISAATISPDSVYGLRPVTYYDRGQWETAGGTVSGLSQQVGLIAEEVAEVPGVGSLLVEFDEDGAPESVNYERVGVVALVALRDLAARVAALEGKPGPARPRERRWPNPARGATPGRRAGHAPSVPARRPPS